MPASNSTATWGLRDEPGWFGVFTREQADGAIPNGTLVVKTTCERGDAHPVGTLGTVLGSLASPPGAPAHVKFFYFVEWHCKRRFAIGVSDFKIQATDGADTASASATARTNDPSGKPGPGS